MLMLFLFLPAVHASESLHKNIARWVDSHHSLGLKSLTEDDRKQISHVRNRRRY